MTKAEQLTKKYRTLLNRYGVNTPLRLSHFWGQLKHESDLEPRVENLNYSAKRIVEIFKTRLDRNRDGWLDENEKAKIREIANNPVKLANFVYANRMGNGNEASGEGFKYRGRGYIQLTGKNNYIDLQKATGIPCVENPDLLLQEANALISALHFWQRNNLNFFADRDDIRGSTRVINGGFNGLSDRIKHINYYKTIFKNEL
jgi:putative chitinase